MISKYSNLFNTQKTPQSQAIPGREKEMEENNAGGYTFTVDSLNRLHRFLILGSSLNTYYVSAKKLTADNAKVVQECLAKDWKRTIDEIVEVSDSGRAPKNDQAIFALAMAVSPRFSLISEARSYAMERMPEVVRTGYHLQLFLEDCKALGRGWGKLMKRGVQSWFQQKNVGALAYQLVKYDTNRGFTMRDILRLAKPVPNSPEEKDIFAYVVGKLEANSDNLPRLPKVIEGYELAKRETDPKKLVKLITDYRLTHEMVPNSAKKDPRIWDALVQLMPMTAMIRNLGVMTACGALAPLNENVKLVASKLGDRDYLKAARVHPINVLTAMRVYQMGHGVKAKMRENALSWVPIPRIVDALEEAFYLAFGNVEATGKNYLLALDVSGSMTSPFNDVLKSHEVTAVMSMVTARLEQNYHIMGFSHQFIDLGITAKDSLEMAMAKTYKSDFGGTDCSLPMIWALQNKIKVDTFSIWTDNQTWKGTIHPSQALQRYRATMGRDAKLVVCATQPTKFSIADPEDGGMLDIAGFDSAVPQIITDFTLGRI